MPRYEHKCLKDICEFLFEVTYGIKEDPKINCPKCASPTQRQIGKNIMFETPVEVDWQGDPKDLSPKSFQQYQEAKKIKYKW